MKNANNTLVRFDNLTLLEVLGDAHKTTQLVVKFSVSPGKHLETLAVLAKNVYVFIVTFVMRLPQHLVRCLLHVGDVFVIAGLNPIAETWNVENIIWVSLITLV